MKKLFIMFALPLLMFSCSSTKVNDYKVKVADTTRTAVVKELKEAYADVVVEGVDCAEEAEMIGDKVYDKLVDVLDADVNKTAQKSLTSSLVQKVCGLSVGYLSDYLMSESSDYACLVAAGAVKLEDVGNDLCSAIDF